MPLVWFSGTHGTTPDEPWGVLMVPLELKILQYIGTIWHMLSKLPVVIAVIRCLYISDYLSIYDASTTNEFSQKQPPGTTNTSRSEPLSCPGMPRPSHQIAPAQPVRINKGIRGPWDHEYLRYDITNVNRYKKWFIQYLAFSYAHVALSKTNLQVAGKIKQPLKDLLKR